VEKNISLYFAPLFLKVEKNISLYFAPLFLKVEKVDLKLI